MSGSSAKAHRLPPNVRPVRYDIDLVARVEDPEFSGRVTILVKIETPVDAVELHARGLDVSQAQVRVDGRWHDARVEMHAERETLTLHAPMPWPPGDAEVALTYTGKVSRSMEGLYLSEDGDDRCLATQCEETDARAIFPCFDEPAFKARFAWRVTTTPEATVLANGTLRTVDTLPDGSRVWSFQATPPMSSYLVALVIGDLAATNEQRVRDVPLRVWATRGRERLGAFGQQQAMRLLPWFEDYFAKPYHFHKYDQVAVPSFSAGAMENSGLVIFRKALLLHDARTTSWRQEKLIARVVAHEMAHMWFGNLVTMQWWDDIWLNESFAEWVAHKATEAISPDYEVWTDFHMGTRDAMESDALRSTHPVYTRVETPEQATELFDAITYQKGSSLLRMLETYMGEASFRAGLRTYMHAFAEGNATGGDLWRHLSNASDAPVTQIMEDWLLKGGHPVVRVERTPAGTLHLSQSRFLSDANAETGDACWKIPLVLRFCDATGVREVRHLLDAPKAELSIEAVGDVAWLDANAGSAGFYRVDPDDDILAGLLGHLEALSVPSQVALLEDQWGLARAARRPLSRTLDTIDAMMQAPRHHAVLATLVMRLEAIEHMLQEAGDDAAVSSFRAWVGARLRPQLDALGSEPRAGESQGDAQSRVHLLRAVAGLAHDEASIAAARRLAEQEAHDSASVSADIGGPAVALAAQFGDASTFERHVALYDERRKSGAAPEEAQRYLESLAAFRAPELVDRTLGLMRDGVLPLEAVGPLLRQMLGKPHAQVAAWKHLTTEWSTVRERLGDMWTGFLVESTGHLPGRLRSEMVAFFDARLQGVAEHSRGRALEALDVRAAFQARTREDLVAWFKRRA